MKDWMDERCAGQKNNEWMSFWFMSSNKREVDVKADEPVATWMVA